MVRLKKRRASRPQMAIAPMIDCVFLMLIYFMVSASLQRQEADVSFQLPGVVEQTEPLAMPDEQIIEIDVNGQVVVNEYLYDSPGSVHFVELTAMLSRFKQASDASRNEAIVSIAPDGSVSHQTIVKVMDACSTAGIVNVNFALEEDDS